MRLNPKSIEKLCNSYVIINKVTYDKYKTRTDDIFQKSYDLNIKSYNLRYPNDRITDEQKEQFYSVNLKSKEKFNNPCEILKTLQNEILKTLQKLHIILIVKLYKHKRK